jgi:pyruvate kinase
MTDTETRAGRGIRAEAGLESLMNRAQKQIEASLPGLAGRLAGLGRAHTKIVATIGPASERRVGELVDAGVSVARINFSHGTADEHRARVVRIRQAAAERGVPLGILADIQGPKLRLASFAGGSRALEEGSRVELVQGSGQAPAGRILFAFEGFLEAAQPGHRVLLSDGEVELVVEEVRAGGATALVRRGGTIADRQGVFLPDTPLDVPLPTPKDVVDIALARELAVDLLGVSFVSRPEDVSRVRALAPECLIVAKIERAAALKNLDGILGETDGIMVARGDLGVEVELSELPLLQKSLIQAALRAGKFTITATEMLESMVASSRPTRAEVTDVANAVLDGTDAVMLSEETAVGRYPVESVEIMARIARSVEASQRYHDLPRVSFRAAGTSFSNATAMAAAEAAEALALSKIVVFTETGNTVRLISRYRPSAEIVALTPSERTLNGMTVLSHVRPIAFPRSSSLEDMLRDASQMLLDRRLVEMGEQVVFVAGVPAGVSRTTNVMKLHRIGELARLS